MSLPLAFFDGLSPLTVLFIMVIAVLLFGEQLPEVARTWGKKFMQFKRNIQGLQDELRSAAYSATSEFTSAVDSAKSAFESSASSAAVEDETAESATAPKFDPPPSEGPLPEVVASSPAGAQAAATAKVMSAAGTVEIPKFQPGKRTSA